MNTTVMVLLFYVPRRFTLSYGILLSKRRGWEIGGRVQEIRQPTCAEQGCLEGNTPQNTNVDLLTIRNSVQHKYM